MFLAAFAGTLIYNRYMRDYEYRSLILVGQFVFIFHMIFSICFIMRITKKLGIDDRLMILAGDATIEVLELVFRFMPQMLLVIKIAPKKVEGTVYAVFGAIQSLMHNVIAPLIGSYLAKLYGVSRSNYANMAQLYVIALMCQMIVIPFLFMIPLRKDIEDWQEKEQIMSRPRLDNQNRHSEIELRNSSSVFRMENRLGSPYSARPSLTEGTS